MNKKEFNLRFLGSVATVALPTSELPCSGNVERT